MESEGISGVTSIEGSSGTEEFCGTDERFHALHKTVVVTLPPVA